MGDRPATAHNSIFAKGYFVADGLVNYLWMKYRLAVTVQNILNGKWKETQFDTESRLFNESAPVSEFHFTPGTQFYAKLSLSYSL